MSYIKPEEERKEELNESNVIPLNLQLGGKEPPSDFWLKNLDVGTVFLSRMRHDSRSFTLGEFAVYNKLSDDDGGMMLLVINEGGRPPTPMWVDPKRFSNQMEKIAILKTNVFEEKKDDEHNRPLQSGGLQDDATTEGEH